MPSSLSTASETQLAARKGEGEDTALTIPEPAVLVSRTVKDLVAGSGLSFEDRGEHELKGVPDRWRLFRAVPA
jgi:class 3 adenylate cyclase